MASDEVSSAAYQEARQELQADMGRGRELEDILDTAYRQEAYGEFGRIKPRWYRETLRRTAETVYETHPETVVELGVGDGGSLYVWSQYFDTATSIAGVDWGTTPEDTSFFRSFGADKGIEVFVGDARQPSTARNVAGWLPGGEIDFLFMDASDQKEDMRKEFESFRPFMSDSGVIAVHDLETWNHYEWCEQHRFWDEVREEYTAEEIVEEDQDWGGTGLLYL